MYYYKQTLKQSFTGELFFLGERAYTGGEHSGGFLVGLTWNDLEQELAGFVSTDGMLDDTVTRQKDGTLQNTRRTGKLQKTQTVHE